MLEKLFTDKRVKIVEISDVSKSKLTVENASYIITVEAGYGYYFDVVIKNEIKYEKDYFIVEGNTIEEALKKAYNKLQEFK